MTAAKYRAALAQLGMNPTPWRERTNQPPLHAAGHSRGPGNLAEATADGEGHAE
jgi:hypothetical protein